MRNQVLILSVIAMLWGFAAVAVGGFSGAMFAIPVAVTAILIVAGWKILPPTSLTATENARLRRLVRTWSTVEAVLIVGAVIGLQNLHATDLIPAAIAIAVGLHFLPLAHGIPERFYYATGAALVAMGVIVPLLATGHQRMVVPLAGGAIILWLTAVAVLLRPRKQAANS